MATRPHPPNGVEHRHLDCDNYDDCIEVAAKGGWTGLHCGLCPRADGEQLLEIPQTRTKAQTGYGPRRSKVITLKTSQEIAESASVEDLSVLAALVKAEHRAGGPASARLIGTFLGTGGKAASLRLTELELRGMVRRYPYSGLDQNRWSLK